MSWLIEQLPCSESHALSHPPDNTKACTVIAPIARRLEEGETGNKRTQDLHLRGRRHTARATPVEWQAQDLSCQGGVPAALCVTCVMRTIEHLLAGVVRVKLANHTRVVTGCGARNRDCASIREVAPTSRATNSRAEAPTPPQTVKHLFFKVCASPTQSVPSTKRTSGKSTFSHDCG